ncbi:MAG: TetR/AcrR family transcriptional regulator [Candidatus Izemoplasmatales bacterium]|uniref:TetR/AcrR family transcriptional regulator n=1 Tax=Hujiaoplasma nucleasis TaxID=2725268 RepID=A0A7L6N4R4_9MOLU|nr:TetR/AcrR family transcriptional regulator [Hujiaoplasma nucleasis]QLY39494.1 TetR/AcrR family transcriptional regulator [Hujiaoplasma nucleasis]
MQVLKESVREAIIESAILEFYNKDYQSANMRDIAKNANITVGNIYRYYPNKQSLFNAILIPAQQAIDLLADFDKNTNLKKIHSKEELDKIIQYVIHVTNPYIKEIFIMIFNSSGTHHHKLKSQIENLIITSLSEYYPGQFTRSFLEVISKSFVEAVFYIFKTNIDNQQKIKILLSDLVMFYFKNLDQRLF